MPVAHKAILSTPWPTQHSANLPLTATAGTDLIPNSVARAVTALSCISSTLISQEAQAIRLTRSMVSWHTGQPALKFQFVVSRS
jgi:hypothetical protein